MYNCMIINSFILISALLLPLCGKSKLIKLDTRDLEIDYFDVRVEEKQRNDSISIVTITRSDGPSSDESMFVIRALCLIAKDREKRYFIILKEGADPKGVYTYTIGFLNDRVDNLKGHFGITADQPVTEKELMDSQDLMAMFGW